MKLPESRGVPRLLALLLAFSLAAAACGGGETADGSTSADADVVEPADAAAEEEASAVEDSDSSAESESTESESTESESTESESTESETADDSAAIENLFPDVDVVNISDGATLNLAAELGGGDTPVLLWFWAPH